MKTQIRKFLPAMVAIALSVVLAPVSRAQCGGLSVPHTRPSSLDGVSGRPHLLRAGLVSPSDDEAPIVGFWHVKFIISTPGGPATIDAGYSQWHSDGTEIMNSGGRAPVTSSFCLGVWSQVGYRTYKLNHLAASWDPTPTTAAPNGVLLGPGQIQEEVVLGPDGNHFAGTFTIDQYDETGKNLAHVAGVITGTRITVNTPEESIF